MHPSLPNVLPRLIQRIGWDEKIKALSKFQMLIIDEMGYLPFDKQEAHHFFQLVSRRYERSSTKFHHRHFWTELSRH
jgi:DNA replication protein DnaC